MTIRDRTVYGEEVGDLLPGLIAFHRASSFDADGMLRSSITLEPAFGEPLKRALMRAEAELLLEDADEIGYASASPRTVDQRTADAFVRLVVAVGKASDSKKR
jgi:hypothetical protein